MVKSIVRNSAKNFSRILFQNLIKKSVVGMSSLLNCEIKLSTIHKVPDSRHLVWVDCEMTGLNILRDRLLEIAVIITDNDLNEIDRLGPLVLKCEKEILDSMDSWCRSTHGQTGLIVKALESDLTSEMVDNMLAEKLNKHSIKGAVLAGNSISYDNLFIRKYLHKTADLLHYRSLDVSSIKILKERWYPALEPIHKQLKHEALSDIMESINELKYYKKNLFK